MKFRSLFGIIFDRDEKKAKKERDDALAYSLLLRTLDVDITDAGPVLSKYYEKIHDITMTCTVLSEAKSKNQMIDIIGCEIEKYPLKTLNKMMANITEKTIKKLLIILIFILPLFSATAADFGGNVSLNSSYDSNAGTNLSTATTGKQKSFEGDISGELSSDIFVYPYKGIYFDYMNSLSYTFTDSQYSFFFQAAEIAYEFEFENLDIIPGFQFGHTVYDFTQNYNRIEVEPYFELMFYPCETFSNSIRLSFLYQKPFDSLDIYNEGYGFSLDAGELLYLFGKKSIR